MHLAYGLWQQCVELHLHQPGHWVPKQVGQFCSGMLDAALVVNHHQRAGNLQHACMQDQAPAAGAWETNDQVLNTGFSDKL